jgi:hypothetical protein
MATGATRAHCRGPGPASSSSSVRSPRTLTEFSNWRASLPWSFTTARTPSASPMLRTRGSAIEELYWTQSSQEASQIWGKRTGAFETA